MSRSTRSRKARRSSFQASFESLEPRRMFAAHIVGSTASYATIQAAVNAAVAGQTITVDAGTYDETVTVNKSLTINGAEAGVDARNKRGAESIVYATQTVFDITANDVTINGFTIEGDDANIGAALGAGVLMGPSIHGTQVLNNIIQNNVTGIYLSNNSNTDQCLIQHNLIQNNFEAGNSWTLAVGENGSRGIYTDGTVSGGYLTNVLINANTIANFNFGGGDEDEGVIALQALGAGKQFNITISDNTLTDESKSLLATNVTNLVYIGNTVTNFNDGSSGPVRFEGNANTVDIQYNSIYDNAGPGVAIDSSGVAGDSSDFVIDNNNIYANDGIGVLTIASVYDGPLYAQNDYWGSASGPSGDGPGTGQAVWGNGNSGHGVKPTGAAGGDAIFSPWSTSLINISAIPVPAAATGLTASVLSSSSIGLTWTPQMSTATSQILQRSTDGVNFTTIATLPPLLNAYTDSGLTGPGYYYRVIASNATGNSTPSNIASTLPLAPVGVAAVALSASRVVLNWTDSSPGIENGFIIQRSTDGVNYTQVGTVGTGVTTFTDNSALAGTTYYYRVAATSTQGNSAFSTTATTTTISAAAVATPLSSLTWTSATTGYGTIQKNLSISGNTLTLDGQTFSTGIGTHAASTIVYNLAGGYTTFTCTVGVDDEEDAGGTGSVDFQVIGDGKVLYDSGILHNRQNPGEISVSVAGVKTLTLVATNGVAGSIDYDHADWAGAYLDSNPVIPASPTNLVATGIGPSLVKLTWTAPASAFTSYSVARSTDGVNFTTVATGISASATTWTDSSVLAASTKYYYEIMAVDAAGSSPASNIASGTTLSLTSVTYVSNLTAISSTVGYGTIQMNKSILGNPLTLDAVVYASGIGTHAASTISYNIAGKYTNFLSTVGIDQEEDGKGNGYVDFQVFGDGVLLFDSGVLTNDQIANIDVSVVGVQTLTLVANNGVANDIDYDHADWANAELVA